ncbi:hypothetical protein [uncultured Mediterranean phage uvMED]|nr:hypothetical protein [uncultured Mediterranean phage uvMED]BAR15029.1 hypothetical protein [uncultured Mediterranean phage uvMED]
MSKSKRDGVRFVFLRSDFVDQSSFDFFLEQFGCNEQSENCDEMTIDARLISVGRGQGND